MQKSLGKEIIGKPLTGKKDSKHMKGVTISTGCILKNPLISHQDRVI